MIPILEAPPLTLDPRRARLWQRLCAFLIDHVVAFLIAVPLVLLLWGAVLVTGGDLESPSTDALSNLLCVILGLTYQVVLVGQNGATYGKRLMKIRIVRLDGERVTGWTALKRIILLCLTSAYFINPLVVLLRKDRRGLHDLLLGTHVVQR